MIHKLLRPDLAHLIKAERDRAERARRAVKSSRRDFDRLPSNESGPNFAYLTTMALCKSLSKIKRHGAVVNVARSARHEKLNVVFHGLSLNLVVAIALALLLGDWG